MTARRSADGIHRDIGRSLLFDAEASRVPVEPRPGIYHRGVVRAAGVIHVGPAWSRVAAYLRDAKAYGRGVMADHHLEEARRRALESDENVKRSCVCALRALLEWVNGDAGLGGAP